MAENDHPMGGAVVTGGGSGIGRAIALRLLREGYGVVVADLHADAGRETVRLAEVEGLGESIVFEQVDVTVETDVERAVTVAVSRFDHLSIMVNNAGVPGAFGPLTEVDAKDWDFTLAVLLRGVFLGTKHAARAFLAQGGSGVVINMASAAGYTAGLATHAYSAAKSAVIAFTRTSALELAPHRVRVVAISPGVIPTPLSGLQNEDLASVLDKAQPWPAHGTSEHVAGVVAFAVSSDAEFITGESIVVDGGFLTHGPGAGFLDQVGLTAPKRAGIRYTSAQVGATTEVR
ncbi:SDR family NAD(P)-dependent oxidoreductase [Nocardia asteroides]|uniref:SDR family NAD(P)-dependent oxidoreductase n=1 Tax=Nocardia asteroides TaxID=1824 RepID=UPI001E3EABAC|nr:SDR family oxidoreductase [Nocardia asteroides]UGT55147.1 SDR family oxidoreductase [Nocardia asteroides]